jgi:hypothetical protein
MKSSTLLPFLSLGLAGCLGAGPQVDSLAAADTFPPPLEVAGEEAQGVELQGDKLGLKGVTFAGAKDANGVAFSEVHVEAGELVGKKWVYSPLVGYYFATIRGVGMKNTTFDAIDSTGTRHSLRIDDVQANPIWSITGDLFDATGKTFFYQVTHLIPGIAPDSTDRWETLCKPNRNGDTFAVPVAALWNASGARVESTTQFTLGCVSGVIAKCEGWGYQPWLPSRELTGHGSIAMKDVHQTCTRTARADYCGDGTPHTYTDTRINVWDLLSPSVNVDDQNEGAPHQMFFESAWRTTGAVCLSKARWDNLPPPDGLCGDKTRGPYHRNSDDVIPYDPSICNTVAEITGPASQPWADPLAPTLLLTESYVERFPGFWHLPFPPFHK